MNTPLRQKMMEDLQLHGLSGRTQAIYVQAVQGRSPRTITNPPI